MAVTKNGNSKQDVETNRSGAEATSIGAELGRQDTYPVSGFAGEASPY